METVYKIPFEKEEGKYSCHELEKNSEPSLELVLGDFGVLEYFEGSVRLYDVDEDKFENTMTAVYDKNGELFKITYNDGESEKLVYVSMDDEETCRKSFEEFAMENASRMAAELVQAKEKISRLFFEWFWDGEAADFSAKLGSEEEALELLKEYPDDGSAVENSGNYSDRYSARCDTDSLSVMLQCTGEDGYAMFTSVVRSMCSIIEEKVVCGLNRTDDFKVVAMEYD